MRIRPVTTALLVGLLALVSLPAPGAAADPPPLGVPRAIVITSITGTAPDPCIAAEVSLCNGLPTTPVVNTDFYVTVQVVDRAGTPVAAAGRTVRLKAHGPKPRGATLTGTLTAVTDGAGTATFVVQFSAATPQLRLRAKSPGLRTGRGTTPVASATGEPFVPLVVAPIPVGTSTVGASLLNGSVGPVTLTYQNAPCQFGLTGACATATLDGTFSDGETHLYTFQSPASVTITCSATNCPRPSNDASQWDEFAAYPIQVSLKVNGVYEPFGTAPACVGQNNDPVTGIIIEPDAQQAGYCVDVYAIYRNGDNGDLVRTILFVEDPRFSPISR